MLRMVSGIREGVVADLPRQKGFPGSASLGAICQYTHRKKAVAVMVDARPDVHRQLSSKYCNSILL